VWNRSLDKARALESVGVVVAATPGEAARGAERVHLVLADDRAVDAVLDQIGGDLAGPVIDHSTLSPAGVRGRFARFERDGKVYQHAPVFMSPSNAANATGMMLISGPRRATFLDALQPMTGKVIDLGERVDQAAAFKLFGNAALITMVAAAADVLAMARAQGIDEEAAMGLFDQFDPGPSLKFRGRKIAKREWKPASFELTMARKDVRLMIEAAGDERLLALPAIAARMDELIAEGEGQSDLGALGKP
jgi:3-hydroxyisobutyrate dehydrogenase-like beta-hydroxyacid dehydrogenase